jgi:hypothetical protein
MNDVALVKIIQGYQDKLNAFAELDPSGTICLGDGPGMKQSSTKAADIGGIYVFLLAQQYQKSQDRPDHALAGVIKGAVL